jgi:hypothetical protein
MRSAVERQLAEAATSWLAFRGSLASGLLTLGATPRTCVVVSPGTFRVPAVREGLITSDQNQANRGTAMNASLLAVLNDTERLMVAETDRDKLAELDEDGAIELETRIRRARNKYVSQHRRTASAAVAEHGGRGKARPENKTSAMKAEAFEEALSRISRRVATLARQAAAQLRGERLAAAKAARQGRGPAAPAAEPAARRRGPAVTGQPTGDRALHSPAGAKRRASTRAIGARRQAKRDNR